MNAKQIPNFFSLLRLFSLPILWFLALFQQKEIFTALFIFAGLTDIVDGNLARKFKATSHLGAKLDTASDDLMTVSAIFCIFFLMPEILFENILPLLTLLILFVIDYAVRFIKFKIIELPFHTLLDKAGALTGFLFLTHALIFGYSRIFFYFLVFVGSLMAIEETILCLTRKKIDENIKSIFLR